MNTDKIVALNIGLMNNNWQMNYKGFMLSVSIDWDTENAGSIMAGYNNANAYTRMDVCVFDSKRKDVTEAFFGKPSVPYESREGGIWAISSFTEFLEHANRFKEKVDGNEMLQKQFKEPSTGTLGLKERKNAIEMLRDVGCIPMHTVCPFRSKCELAQGGVCLHHGENHMVGFSCAVARGFLITEKE